MKKDIAANKSEFSDATEEPASISRSMPVRAVKSCFQDLQQLLEEMNSDITASEATELDHKKTFEELSDTKKEEIVASTQEAQETKLSNDRKNWKGPRSTLMNSRHFLRISTQLDISEIQTTADSIEISMRMKIRHAITSARRSELEFSRHARRSHLLEEVVLLACGWRDVQNWKSQL